MAAPESGGVTWLELPAVSFVRAAKFYADAFGWETKGISDDGKEPEGMPSTLPGVESLVMFSKGKLNGCFLKYPASAISKVAAAGTAENVSPVVTYAVDSIEETLAKVEKAGGKVHVPKTAIGGDMGHFARFVDTEGNLQGVWALN